MNCFICNEEILEGFLCKNHAIELYNILKAGNQIVKEPDWKYHCQICGEYENRVIIEYSPFGYFCNIDIEEEIKRYFGSE